MTGLMYVCIVTRAAGQRLPCPDPDGEFQPARLHSSMQGAARIKSGGETNTLQSIRMKKGYIKVICHKPLSFHVICTGLNIHLTRVAKWL